MQAAWVASGSRDHLVVTAVEYFPVPAALRARYDAARAALPAELRAEAVREFHGTTAGAVSAIFYEGFSVPATFERRSGDAEGRLRFGRAVYTTAAFAKAVSYADGVVIVCRTLPGRVRTLEASFEALTPEFMRKEKHDSVLATLAGEPPERAFYDAAQLLPEVVIRFRVSTDLDAALPAVLPATDAALLLRYLGASAPKQLEALRLLGDLFRDHTAATNAVVRRDPAAFFVPAARLAAEGDEQMAQMALRCFWNMSYADKVVQHEVIARVGAPALLAHVGAASESLLLRAVGVLLQVTHLEPRNHHALVAAQADLGPALLRVAQRALERDNATLAAHTLNCLANIFSSGLVAGVTRHSALFDKVLGMVLFAAAPGAGVTPAVTEATIRLTSNFIMKGEVDHEWVRHNFQAVSGAARA